MPVFKAIEMLERGEPIDAAAAYEIAESALQFWDKWCADDGRPAAGLSEAKRLLDGGEFDHERWTKIRDGVFWADRMASRQYWPLQSDTRAGAAYCAAAAIIWLLNGCLQMQPGAIAPDLQDAWERAVKQARASRLLGLISYPELWEDGAEG